MSVNVKTIFTLPQQFSRCRFIDLRRLE